MSIPTDSEHKRSYRDFQTKAEREYRDAYITWQKEDPEGFAKAKAAGLASPKLDNHFFDPVAPTDPDPINTMDCENAPPLLPEALPEEIFADALIFSGIIKKGTSRPQLLTAISRAMEDFRAECLSQADRASSTRLADVVLRTLQVVGCQPTLETISGASPWIAQMAHAHGFSARIALAVIGRGDGASLAEISEQVGNCRAAGSKIATDLIERFNLPSLYVTRSEATRDDNAERAAAIHAIHQADRATAAQIRASRDADAEKNRQKKIAQFRKAAQAKLTASPKT